MLRKLMMLLVAVTLVLASSDAQAKGRLSASVRGVGSACSSLGRFVRATVVIETPVSVNRGGSSSASLGVQYRPDNQSTSIAYAGGCIRTRNMRMSIVAEVDRPIKSITTSLPTGWNKSWNYPRLDLTSGTGSLHLPFTPSPRLAQEVLTIVVLYCDARGVPDGDPQLYEYTIDRSPQ